MKTIKKTFVLLCALLLLLLTACAGAPAPDYTPEEILDAVREAYGDNYLPDSAMDETYITDVLGIDLTQVDAFAGEMPMISLQADRVLILKAKEGKGADVETDVLDALDEIKAQVSFYPMSMAKANAAKVVRHGDYVCLLMVGAPDDTSETDEEAAAFAEEQVLLAVDAVDALFK